ncbi:MAG TPA: hypothetical protein VF138_11725 [Caulobacteraceae bacterium]
MSFATMTISRRIRFVIFGVAASVVAWLSLIPRTELPKTGVSDKWEHLVVYALLTLVGAWTYRSRAGLGAVLVGYGVVLEILQGVMGLGRQADVVDALANSLGVVIGLSLVLLARKLRR